MPGSICSSSSSASSPVEYPTHRARDLLDRLGQQDVLGQPAEVAVNQHADRHRLAIGMLALEQDRAGVVEHRLAHHRGADDLRLADLLDPPRDAGRRRRAGEQLRRQGAQLAVVELRDRRQRDRRGGIVEGRQPGDKRLAEQQRGIDLERVRERQSMPLLAEGAEQVRRPRLGVERRVDLPPPTARSSARHGPPRGCARVAPARARAAAPPEPDGRRTRVVVCRHSSLRR